MDPIETFTHAGLTVDLHYDETGGTNPRDNDGNIVVIYQSAGRGYHDVDDAPELAAAIDRWGEHTYGRTAGSGDPARLIERYMRIFHDVIAIDTWEANASQGDNFHGWAYVTRQAMLDEGWSAEDVADPAIVERRFRSELDEFTAWGRGEVYGFTITDPETGEQVGGCWGFIGDDAYNDAGEKDWRNGMSYVEREARAEAEALAPIVAASKIDAATQAHLAWCLNVVTVAQIITEQVARIEWSHCSEIGQPRYIAHAESIMDTFGRDAPRRPDVVATLEYLRGELRAESISWGELGELQSLAPFIEPGDVELLEPAGVPEFPQDGCADCLAGHPVSHTHDEDAPANGERAIDPNDPSAMIDFTRYHEFAEAFHCAVVTGQPDADVWAEALIGEVEVVLATHNAAGFEPNDDDGDLSAYSGDAFGRG